MSQLKKWCKHALTDENGDFDPILGVIIFAVLYGCALSGFDVWRHGTTFDFGKFGEGISTILGAGGLGYGLKRVGEKYGSTSTSNTES